MDLSSLPKNPTYALTRYLQEALRLVSTSAALLNSVAPIVEDSAHEEITHPDIVTVIRMTEELVFQRIVDNFQTYIVDIMAEIFSTKPEMIPSGEIDRRIVFRNGSLSEIRINIVEDFLRSFSYRSMSDMSDWFSKNFSFPFIDRIEDRRYVQSVIEIRNLLVHNRGMTDYRYRQDFSAGGRSSGKRTEVPTAVNTLKLLTDIASDIDKRAEKKFGLEKVPSKNG